MELAGFELVQGRVSGNTDGGRGPAGCWQPREEGHKKRKRRKAPAAAAFSADREETNMASSLYRAALAAERLLARKGPQVRQGAGAFTGTVPSMRRY